VVYPKPEARSVPTCAAVGVSAVTIADMNIAVSVVVVQVRSAAIAHGLACVPTRTTPAIAMPRLVFVRHDGREWMRVGGSSRAQPCAPPVVEPKRERVGRLLHHRAFMSSQARGRMMRLGSRAAR